MIRNLTIAVAALSLIWSGYWIWGSRLHRGLVIEQLEKAQAKGWTVSYSGLELNGFPNRFDTTITELSMRSPNGDFIWEAPSLRLLTLSYRPNHLIAMLPDMQRFVVAGNAVDATSQGMRASIEVSDPDVLLIKRLIVEIPRAEFESSAGWKGSVDSALFAMRESEERPNEINLALRLGPSPFSSAAEDAGAADGPSRLIGLAAEASLQANREFGLNMCKDGHAEIQRADISELRLSAGAAELGVSGSLAFDSQGVSDGRLEVAIANGQLLVAEAVEAGLIDANVGTMLFLLAMASASPGSETAPILISNGRISFAGAQLYDAPRLPPICD